MNKIKGTYRVIRGVVFTALVVVVAAISLLYIALSMPPVTDFIRKEAEKQLSDLFGGKVAIGRLAVHPFNEVMLENVVISGPDEKECLHAERIGAGISLWRLISEQRIEISYVELLDFKATINQSEENGPLNIDFIIKAFAKKDKNKPPAKFDLNIRNIVIRGGSATFDKLWKTRRDTSAIDFNHLCVSDLRADVAIPILKNDTVVVDLRRLAFKEKNHLTVEKIGAKVSFTSTSLGVNNLRIQLPGTLITPADFSVNYTAPEKLIESLKTTGTTLLLVANKITPSDFRGFYPPLSSFSDPLYLTLEASGNEDQVKLNNFRLTSPDFGLDISLSGFAENITDSQSLRIQADQIDIGLGDKSIASLIDAKLGIPAALNELLKSLGSINTRLNGYYASVRKTKEIEILGDIITQAGDLRLEARGNVNSNTTKFKVKAEALGMKPSVVDNRIPVSDASFSLSCDAEITGKEISGLADLYFSEIEYNQKRYKDISLLAEKRGNEIKFDFQSDNPGVDLTLQGNLLLAGAASDIHISTDIKDVNTSLIGVKLPQHYNFSGSLEAHVTGNDIDTADGFIRIDNLAISSSGGKNIGLNRFLLTLDKINDIRRLQLNSDWLSLSASGNLTPSALPGIISSGLSETMPSLFSSPRGGKVDGSLTYSLKVAPEKSLTEFFNLPLSLLTDLEVTGEITGEDESFTLQTSMPYLLQGKDKLVRDLSIQAAVDGASGTATIAGEVMYPTKKGDLKLGIDLEVVRDLANLRLLFNEGRDVAFSGSLSLSSLFSKSTSGKGIDADIHLFPTSLFLNGAEWNVGASHIQLAEKRISAENFSVRHADQFVTIEGTASANPDDRMLVTLSDIDLSYIFDTLNINYVNFGGIASGEIEAKNLLSGALEAATKRFEVKDLSYNGAVLGNGSIYADFLPAEKKVNIRAEVTEDSHRTATIDGGIWIGRDSLSFGIDADKVNIKFLQPFMSAFTSNVEGRASGKAKLFGTFKDIDLTGRIFADRISMLVDYTNVTYSGSDSVILDPGRIVIPGFILHDKFGHTARLTGELTHRYFHEPVFRFDVADVSDLLCYDTNSSINPDWYGTVYANGNARITGRPGYVGIFADMVTRKNTNFTFVLNDFQLAEDFDFLTFTDKRKERQKLLQVDDTPDFLKDFNRRRAQSEGTPSVFELDLRVSATPDARMNLIMDPQGGDKIMATGSGGLNITYNSESDEMKMFGKYVLESGRYNFTLQDLILKDFEIKPGSEISFTGDPLAGVLDITAAYRVNTNLTDLDKSFATDRDLNRTNVPVEALLMVKGPMTHPDISFDIDLPTVTEETRRKVRSIISTEDLMSKQVIYLLALNRFYTPEYMGNTSNGGEWASVASSTLSSQLQNVLGQLTDKFTLAPSLRSDKGDFSDLEVDVALSSRLLDNRLLLNGNFGYRDRSTSNTTFVGDFDIEYLLNRAGSLRLKAYNHFNDQNYYLKSALTTQGIGVVYRKDFDNPFTFLKRRRKSKKRGADQ